MKMTAKTKTLEKNNSLIRAVQSSVWSKAFTSNSEWPDKVQFIIFKIKVTKSIF